MLSGIHNIHFIGIGGAGMSALAHVLCAVSYTHLTLPTKLEV